jgi:hypothetical protein
MPKKAEKLFVTILEVRGSGEFPWDMLRYDMCGPKTEEDSYKLRTSEEVRTVTLRRFSPSGKPATEDRWRSFGWQVLSEVSPG